MTEIKMVLLIADRLRALSLAAIGREPNEVETSGLDNIRLVYTPDLTPADLAALNNALPDWFQKLYRITVK